MRQFWNISACFSVGQGIHAVLVISYFILYIASKAPSWGNVGANVCSSIGCTVYTYSAVAYSHPTVSPATTAITHNCIYAALMYLNIFTIGQLLYFWGEGEPIPLVCHLQGIPNIRDVYCLSEWLQSYVRFQIRKMCGGDESRSLSIMCVV